MRKLFLLAGLAAAIPAAARSAVTVPPKAEQDLQCFVIAAVAAGKLTDQNKQAAIAATWYFLGRLDMIAPGLDLAQATRQEIATLQRNPKTAGISQACDARFSKRGADLASLGKRMQNSSPQAVPHR